MSSLNTINVGGISYDVEDASSRTLIPMVAYKEDGDTASQAYAIVGTPINWKGTLYYTKTAVAQGATWVVDTNLTLATNLGGMISNIKTYVNNDGELVFRDATGADSVLPFSKMSLIGSGSTSYNIANIRSDYASLTANDFLLVVTENKSVGVSWYNRRGVSKGHIGGLAITTSKSYNNTTGVLTVSGSISYTGTLTDDDGNNAWVFNKSLDITSVIAVYCGS